MASQSSYSVSIRWKDYAQFKRELDALGPAGEKALQRLEKATKPPTAGMRAMREATTAAKEGIAGFADQLGPVGGILTALGPAGVAAAAGIGVLTAGLALLYRAAGDAIETFGTLTDQAAQLGIAFDRFQALQYGFAAVGVEADQLTRGLTKFNDAIGQMLAKGEDAPKELQIAFARLGISVKDLQGIGGDTYQALLLVADGMAKLGTRAEQTTVAGDLFGIKNAKLIDELVKGRGVIEDYSAAAARSGAILSADVATAADAAGDRLAQLTLAMNTQWAELSARLIPAHVALAEAKLGVVQGANAMVDAFSRLDGWLVSALARVHPLTAGLGALAAVMRQVAGAAPSVGKIEERAQSSDLDKLLSSTDLEIARSKGRDLARAPKFELPEHLKSKKGGRSASEREADRLAKEIERATERDAKIVDELQRSLQNFSDDRAQFIDRATSRLSEHASAETVAKVKDLAAATYDLAQAERVAEKAAAEKEQRKQEGIRIRQSLLTVDEAHAESLKYLAQLYEESAIDAETYGRATKQAHEDAADAARRQLDDSREFTDGLRRGITDWAGEATNAAAIAENAFQSAADGMTDALTEFIMTGKADFASFATALVAEINRVIIRMTIALALQKAMGLAAGGFAGTGASGGATTGSTTISGGGGGVYSSQTYHGGGIVGIDGGPSRLVSMTGAPRLHGGLMPGEFPAVLQRGEGVFTPAQMRAMASPINVTVNNTSRASVDVRQSADGVQIDIADLIDRTAAGLVQTPGSRLHRAMRG